MVDGGETRILLQIFSKTVIGPIFFEFIQPATTARAISRALRLKASNKIRSTVAC